MQQQQNQKPAKRSTAIERIVQAYPPPKYHQLLCADAKVSGVSRSNIVCDALKAYYDRMPEQEKQRILRAARNSY